MRGMSECFIHGATPKLTIVNGGLSTRELCVVCGADVEGFYVCMDWGLGREAICGRVCADLLLDALDDHLQSQGGQPDPEPSP